MKYPIRIQTFEKMIESGNVFVDKMNLVYRLAQGNTSFLSRPRRFRKRLNVTILEFQRQKEK